MEYYAMITPGLGGDWGQVILIDARTVDFCERFHKFKYAQEDVKVLKKKYKNKEWDFLKSEFNATEKSDIDFIDDFGNEWYENNSDNYCNFRDLESTYHFNSVTELIAFTQENDVKVVGDLT